MTFRRFALPQEYRGRHAVPGAGALFCKSSDPSLTFRTSKSRAVSKWPSDTASRSLGLVRLELPESGSCSRFLACSFTRMGLRPILRDRVKAGIAQARKESRPHGRPTKIAGKTQEIQDLARKGLSKSAIAKQLNIGRTSVRRLLGNA